LRENSPEFFFFSPSFCSFRYLLSQGFPTVRKLPVFLLDTQIPLAVAQKEKRKRTMKHLLKDFLFDMLRQLLGWPTPRSGILVLTTSAKVKMQQLGIDVATLQDTFTYGEVVDKGDKMQITRKYANYSVGLWYKTIYTPYHHNIPSEKRYLIITCWKGGEQQYV
jgi:hypothetical protein